MKRGLLILMFGLVAAAAAYGCIYLTCTASARNMQRSDKPELAWLKEEFNLSDAEFKRVSELHAAYLPQCAAMCKQIDAQNLRLQGLLAATNQITPEIETAIAEVPGCAASASVKCSTIFMKSAARCHPTRTPLSRLGTG